MAEIDYVIPAIKIEQKATFNFADLYRLLKSWFDLHSYDFFEKEYIDVLKEGGEKSDSIKWEAEKKIDDYIKFHIEIRLKLSDVVNVQTKEAMACKGVCSLKFESFIQKDYEDLWERNFFLKFSRALYDHFIMKAKYDRYADELKKETYEVFNQAKSFLNLRGER
ncbi:MAG: hypothetical protein QGF74_02120 [Candidatus Nanoarchaeia archaeon]|jgi:hypothetical protein|nr:hypothetical protein [Candidatus Nanoarchaeia archaeon]|tara:strand:- start:60161 stop:60655 length:495 start_codon:yes stop_codon:yes gene_type:complete